VAFQYKDLVSSVLPPARAAAGGTPDGLEAWLACEESTERHESPKPGCLEGTVPCPPDTQLGNCPDGITCIFTDVPDAPCQEGTALPCEEGTRHPERPKGTKHASGGRRHEREARRHHAHPRHRAAADLALLQEQLRRALEQGP